MLAPPPDLPAVVVRVALGAAERFWDRQGVPARPDCPEPSTGFADLPRGIGAEAPLGGCWIKIHSGYGYGIIGLCGVITHELGHVRGLDHQSTGIMAASFTGSTPECDALLPGIGRRARLT